MPFLFQQADELQNQAAADGLVSRGLFPEAGQRLLKQGPVSLRRPAAAYRQGKGRGRAGGLPVEGKIHGDVRRGVLHRAAPVYGAPGDISHLSGGDVIRFPVPAVAQRSGGDQTETLMIPGCCGPIGGPVGEGVGEDGGIPGKKGRFHVDSLLFSSILPRFRRHGKENVRFRQKIGRRKHWHPVRTVV